MTNEELYQIILNQKSPEKLVKAWTIKDVLIQTLASMFTYKNLPESINEDFIERYLIMNGSAAVWILDNPLAVRYKDELIVSIGCPAERPDAYGIGKNYIASTMDGYVKTLDDSTGAIGWNNSLHISDMALINNFTDMLTEMFVSLKANVLYSRYKPVFKASDDKEKRAIEEAFSKIKDDLAPIVITSSNVLAELEGNPETIKTFDITDVKNSDKLQYIIKSIEDIFRLFYTLYGQCIQGNGKKAQQTVDEVEGSTSTSFILPNDRLKQRRKWIEKINKLFDKNYEVDFSDAWKTESIKYKKEADIDDNGELEELTETGEETVKETETETEKQTEEETVKETEEETEERKEREEE